jgi:hypothetical protein
LGHASRTKGHPDENSGGPFAYLAIACIAADSLIRQAPKSSREGRNLRE